MSDGLVWNDGAPPAVGWYRTTDNFFGDSEQWRWWDGACWSYFAEPVHTPGQAAAVADIPLRWPECVVQWSDYWPADARVERGV